MNDQQEADRLKFLLAIKEAHGQLRKRLADAYEDRYERFVDIREVNHG